jgi:hypothetical protein
LDPAIAWPICSRFPFSARPPTSFEHQASELFEHRLVEQSQNPLLAETRKLRFEAQLRRRLPLRL